MKIDFSSTYNLLDFKIKVKLALSSHESLYKRMGCFRLHIVEETIES